MGARAIANDPRAEVEQARAEMLAALVDELNQAGVPYCLLSGYHGYPQAEDSDVDFMVRPEDAGSVARWLQAVTRRCGGLLVQAIQHETGAWYFALAKQVRGGVAYLHPDCTTDYRRNGRLWLRSEELLARRRRLTDVYLPAVEDEFEYYLLKKVLKQQIDAAQLQRLRRLYLSDPAECCARMRQHWPAESVSGIVSALLSNNVTRMRWHLPVLLRELQASAPLEGMPGRAVQAVREWWRWMRRALHPTGMAITVCGGGQKQREEFAAALQGNLRPAFRRTQVVDSQGPLAVVRDWVAKARSTLVIRKLAATRGVDLGWGGVAFLLDSSGEPDVESATRVVLEWMAKRVARPQRCEG